MVDKWWGHEPWAVPSQVFKVNDCKKCMFEETASPATLATSSTRYK